MPTMMRYQMSTFYIKFLNFSLLMTIQHLFSYSFVVVSRRLYSWVHPHAFQIQSLFQNIMDASRKLNKNTNLAAKIRCLYSALRGCVASRDIRQNSSVSQQQGSWLHRVIQGPRHFSVWGSAVFLGILLFDDHQWMRQRPCGEVRPALMCFSPKALDMTPAQVLWRELVSWLA